MLLLSRFPLRIVCRILASGIARLLLLLVAVFLFSACHRTRIEDVAPQFVPKAGVNYSFGMLHRVAKGDCLTSVSQFYSRRPDLLVALNELKPPYYLEEGTLLYIPPADNDAIVRSKKVTMAQIRQARLTENKKVAEGGAEEKPIDTSSWNASSLPQQSSKSRFSLRSRNSGVQTPPPSHVQAFAWPVSGCPITRGFQTEGEMHYGIDLAVPQGTEVHAAAAGKVVFSGSSASLRNYGNLVCIDHGDGFCTIYAHNSKLMVELGQKVTKGQTVALSGATGKATGPHVHLELRYNGRAIDPADYFEKSSGKIQVAARRE